MEHGKNGASLLCLGWCSSLLTRRGRSLITQYSQNTVVGVRSGNARTKRQLNTIHGKNNMIAQSISVVVLAQWNPTALLPSFSFLWPTIYDTSTYIISDGDSKTFALLSRERVYGANKENQVEKLDCVGHVQKRLGTALRNLKLQHHGQKLSDGKTIGGAFIRFTDKLTAKLLWTCN